MGELENETAGNRSTERRYVQSIRRLGVEVVVGFIGVYAAFALSAYKDRQDQVERRHQIKRALIAEITPIVALSRSNQPAWSVFLQQFDSSVVVGHPAPRPFIQSVAVADHVWEATKQAGGLNLIDVPTFVALANFYNVNSENLAQYGQIREFSIAEILPRMGTSPDAYFIPGTKTVRKAFEIYRYALRRLGQRDSLIIVRGDSLIKRLARDTI